MKSLLTLLIFLILFRNCFSQTTPEQGQPVNKFYIIAGYGVAGSFFVRSYDEFNPLPDNAVFYKKNFIGVAQNIGVGINLKNNYQIQFGFNFQHFTRHINVEQTLGNVFIYLDHTIHHRDYIWYGGLNKGIGTKKHFISPGLGIYYLRPKQEEVEIYSRYFSNVERGFKKFNLEEGGVYAELAYEYKFQPRVNIGVKSQFYYTITAGYAESITLFPYVKILF